jgi:indoleamine 2,3-dioxygenase
MSQPDLSRTFAYFEDTVDAVTGFLPRELPLKRLPQEWEAWEAALDDAITSKIQVGAKFDISNEEVKRSSSWRDRVMKVPHVLL